ncbi:MAG TPA: hypothetical protein VNR70_05330 [Steroidobacteraceae bacterium]|jgi:hypothetical protein|nr:hypothetical protein [Steroidobacteraceae bacterium]
MREPEVLVPVTCPQCGAESVARLDVSVVADALMAGTGLPLTAKCHSMVWQATPLEIEQIREYLVASCIDLHRSPAVPASAELR